jgi:hypothetical protein
MVCATLVSGADRHIATATAALLVQRLRPPARAPACPNLMLELLEEL